MMRSTPKRSNWKAGSPGPQSLQQIEILTEFLTFFSRGLRLRRRAVDTVRELTRDPNIHIFSQSRAPFQAGFDLYAARSDKRYSLVDCIAMTTMRRKGLTEILTNDRHFEQEGFRALFRA
jgi:predicted nucleic acid-binding protein